MQVNPRCYKNGGHFILSTHDWKSRVVHIITYEAQNESVRLSVHKKSCPVKRQLFNKSSRSFVNFRNTNRLFPVEDIHKFAVLIQDQHFLS